jgi:arginyl-tRNA synthetase
VNYAYARINSIFNNLNKTFDDTKEIKLDNLQKAEKELLFYALQLPYELEDAFKHREPHRVTNFLISLAAKTHSFYNSNKVAGDEREAIRLKVLATVATVIKTGLNILGIDVKGKM